MDHHVHLCPKAGHVHRMFGTINTCSQAPKAENQTWPNMPSRTLYRMGRKSEGRVSRLFQDKIGYGILDARGIRPLHRFKNEDTREMVLFAHYGWTRGVPTCRFHRPARNGAAASEDPAGIASVVRVTGLFIDEVD